jgi:adenosylcobinamide-phosphate synthase
MGSAIGWYERMVLKYLNGKLAQFVAGVLLALGLPVLCFSCTQWIIDQAQDINGYVGYAVWILLGYTALAARDLADHAMRVYRALVGGSLEEARQAVSCIVGRDTATMSEPEVIRATIETVAESSSDGVIAPLLYLALGGPPLALAYKAVNTLDSMIGHRTAPYQHFGWASARLDDLMNWVPARLCGLCLVLAAGIRLGTLKSAWKAFLRDGRKHLSPNSGWPEAAMAGALQVQVGGLNRYAGTPIERPKLGDPIHTLNPSLIPMAVQLMAVASGVMLVILLLMLWEW